MNIIIIITGNLLSAFKDPKLFTIIEEKGNAQCLHTNQWYKHTQNTRITCTGSFTEQTLSSWRLQTYSGPDIVSWITSSLSSSQRIALKGSQSKEASQIFKNKHFLHLYMVRSCFKSIFEIHKRLKRTLLIRTKYKLSAFESHKITAVSVAILPRLVMS